MPFLHHPADMGSYAGYIQKRAFQIDKSSFQQFLQVVDFAGALFHPTLAIAGQLP
jgi:hypothetical protein